MNVEGYMSTGGGMARGGKREGQGRPPKPPGEKRVNVTIRFHPESYERIKRLAEQSGLSVAKYIESLLPKEP